MWLGKMIGALAGFSLGGPFGAVLGAIAGHTFDRGLTSNVTGGATWRGNSWSRSLLEGAVWHRRRQSEALPEGNIQTVFFRATFLVMGRIAKSDGRVSDEEIGLAQSLMDQLQLSPNMKKHAIELFSQGKQLDFDLEPTLNQFHSLSGRGTSLIQMFMEIQCQAAFADGYLHKSELQLINQMADLLHYPKRNLEQIILRCNAFYGSDQRSWNDRGSAGGDRVSGDSTATEAEDVLAQAYDILGVNDAISNVELKRAYRRLMSQHHPDKLVAKGLPEEMMVLATEKTQQISTAFELIRQSRS